VKVSCWPADIDRIEALSADRAALWDRVNKAQFLSVNEKRLAVGYGAIEGGDVFRPPH
jgi:phage portal protein BeeE